jgi:hypothetical protein
MAIFCFRFERTRCARGALVVDFLAKAVCFGCPGQILKEFAGKEDDQLVGVSVPSSVAAGAVRTKSARQTAPWRCRSCNREEMPALEHDPEKWKPVFPRDKRGTRLRGDHAQTKR